MRSTTIFVIALTATFTLSLTDVEAKDEIYRWVDENGLVHFDDQPDPQGRAEQIDVQSSSGISAQPAATPAVTGTDPAQAPAPSYAQQRRDERAEARRKAAQEQEVYDEACAQRRQLVAQMAPSTRLMATNEDGEVVRMDDNDRLEILDEAKTYIAANCDK
jgi:hypothetical protein